MNEIIPAILTNSFDELERKIRLIEPHTSRAHLDIADGTFVFNKTISGYSELELVSTGLKFDVHLMVTDPLNYINNWNEDNADRFIVHIESREAVVAIKELRRKNKGVGLALNPDTPIKEIEPYIGLLDFVHFMTVNPGFQGGDFLDPVVRKISYFHEKYPEVVVAVDGGINPATAKDVVKAGASVLVSGSFVIKSNNVGKAIEELKKISISSRA